MSSRVLVTGGAGFIGSHLVAALVERGDRVRVLDDLSTGHRGRLERLLDAVELVEGDLRDPARVRAAVAGSDVVFHLGALPSVPRSLDEDRKSVVSGKSVDLGGRRIIKKKKIVLITSF